MLASCSFDLRSNSLGQTLHHRSSAGIGVVAQSPVLYITPRIPRTQDGEMVGVVYMQARVPKVGHKGGTAPRDATTVIATKGSWSDRSTLNSHAVAP